MMTHECRPYDPQYVAHCAGGVRGGVIYNGNSCCKIMLVSDGLSCFERVHCFLPPSIDMHFCSLTVVSVHSIVLFSSVG